MRNVTVLKDIAHNWTKIYRLICILRLWIGNGELKISFVIAHWIADQILRKVECDQIVETETNTTVT